MKILIVTDAWRPQLNGVVVSLEHTIAALRERDHNVEIISPADFRLTFPLPTYPDIRLAPFAGGAVRSRILAFAPDAVHIATEGPLGWAARRACLDLGLSFTTSYHTRFPEYVKARLPQAPLGALYAWVRRFHGPSQRIMVTSPSMARLLTSKGFERVSVLSGGVDTGLFNSAKRAAPSDIYAGLPRPIFINVGRVAVEKNISAFLDLDLPGTKVVIGDGPQLSKLRAEYPDVHFTGPKYGEELARHFADADVFVFPSKTDTFGLVILEAMACGTPVAAYPVTGPLDILPGSGGGVMNNDLRKAALECLAIDRAQPEAYAQGFGWQAIGQRFEDMLALQTQPWLLEARSRKRLSRLGRRTLVSSFYVLRPLLRGAAYPVKVTTRKIRQYL